MNNLDFLTGESLFETPRLRCRRWLPSDLEAIYAVYSDREAVRWVDDGEPISPSECKRWLHVTAKNYQMRGYGMFALEDRSTGQVIGFCGLVHPDGQTVAEIKYAFLRSHWGHGLASEIVPALISYGASQYRLLKVIATVAAPNRASRRVLEKSGLVVDEKVNNPDGSITLIYAWVGSGDPTSETGWAKVS